MSRHMQRRSVVSAGMLALAGALLACGQSSVPDDGTPPSSSGPSRCGEHPWCDTGLSVDARTELLLAAMTRDEKVELMGGNNHPAAGQPGVGAARARPALPPNG